MQKLIGPITKVHVDKALVATNAVLQMDHRVVDLELRKIANDGVHIGLFGSLAMPLAPLQIGKELKLGNKNKAQGRGLEALMEWAYGKQAACPRALPLGLA